MKLRIPPVAAAIVIALACSSPLLRADNAAAAHTAAVEDLLAAMHSDETLNKVLARQKEAIIKMLPQLLPKDTPPETVQQMQQIMPALMDTVYKQLSWESLKPDFVEIYGTTFTDDEIKGLTEFYKTPLGQKLVEKMPDISQKCAQIIQRRMPSIMGELQKIVAENLQQANAARKTAPPASPDTGMPPSQ